MHAFHWNARRNFDVVVRDKRNGSSRCNLVKLAGKIDKFIDRFLFSAQLDKIDTSFDHRFGYARRIRRIDIVEIDDAVEPAVHQRFHQGCL